VTGEEQLRALVGQAFELRETPYCRDAVDAIVEWHARRYLRRLEHEQERAAELAQLLREESRP
jgi:hypothetical protein